MIFASNGGGPRGVRALTQTANRTRKFILTPFPVRAKLEGYDRHRARRAGWTRRFIPTGLAPLDAMLPNGGLPCGTVIEILSEGSGVGAMSLAMRIAAQCYQESPISEEMGHASISESAYPRGLKPAAQGLDKHHECYSPGQPEDRRSIILLDTFEDFYPPAAWQHGIALDRLIVLRTRNVQDAFWAADQSLRCSAVAAVIAPFRRLDERHSRRLQLAAQSSGSVGLILKPAGQRVKSFAAVQMLLEVSDPYLCRITLLAVREGTPAEPAWVDLHHEAGIGPEHPVPVDRSAAKTA